MDYIVGGVVILQEKKHFTKLGALYLDMPRLANSRYSQLYLLGAQSMSPQATSLLQRLLFPAE